MIFLFTLTGILPAASFSAPKAKNGILDLRGWNPAVDGPVDLSGQWDFFWKKLLRESDFQNGAPLPDARPHLPSFWNDLVINGEKLDAYGYGTYRLNILLDKTDQLLAIKNRLVFTAFALYVDGKKISSAGIVGRDRHETKPEFNPGVKCFNTDTGEIHLVLHVSNFHQHFGGAGRKLIFGRAHDLQELRESSIAIDLMVFGCLLIVGLYYLVLFWYRRKDYSTLFFSVFCLLMSFRTLLSGEKFLLKMYPDISYWFVVTVLDVFYYFSVMAFLLYTAYLFYRFVSRRVVQFFVFVMSSGVVIIAVTPVRYNGFINNFFHVITGAILLYLFFCAVNAATRKVFGARLYISGFIVLLLATVNDILFNYDFIQTMYLAPYGLVAFILIQTFVLSGKFSRAFNNVEKLTGDLAEVNKNLSGIVEERTEELSAAMEELQASNENLLSVNRDLEEARKTANRDIEMAAHVQRSYFPDMAPFTENWDIACYFQPTLSVSGDFYDFYLDGKSLRGVGLFDVSGHGIASGLITMLAKATFFRTFMRGLERPLNEVIGYANGILQGELEKVDNYLTGVLLRFKDKTVEYANAAHTDILLRQSGNVKAVLKENSESISGVLLGVPLFNLPYEILTFSVDSGDTILMFSDCLVENKNITKDFYGKERVIESFNNAPDASAREMLDFIIEDFLSFVGSKENLTDDLTVLLLRRK